MNPEDLVPNDISQSQKINTAGATQMSQVLEQPGLWRQRELGLVSTEFMEPDVVVHTSNSSYLGD
jgi:hypothetical protein